MNETKEMIERLRAARVIEPKMPSEHLPTILGKQAADLIEKLLEENKELKAFWS